MLNIAILDDEDMYVDRIREITEKCMGEMGIDCKTRVYKNGEDLLEGLQKEEYFDLYLLDVELPGINGLQVAKHIRRRYSEPILIYISNYGDYAINAYKVDTYRYIPKQILEEELSGAYRSMETLLRGIKRENGFYTIEHYKDREKIYFRDIYYLMKDGKYVVFVHKKGERQVRATMEEICKQLPAERFLMIDRSYVINVDYIKTLKKYEIQLQNEKVLPVSQSKWPAVRDFFMDRE